MWRQMNKSEHENVTVGSLFSGVPSNIQAAYEYPNEHSEMIIFFKGYSFLIFNY